MWPKKIKLLRKLARPLKQMTQRKLRKRAKMRKFGRKKIKKALNLLRMAPSNSCTARNKPKIQNRTTMLRSMINLTSSLMMRRHMIKKTFRKMLL